MKIHGFVMQIMITDIFGNCQIFLNLKRVCCADLLLFVFVGVWSVEMEIQTV